VKATAGRESSRNAGVQREEASRGLNELFLCHTQSYPLGNLLHSCFGKNKDRPFYTQCYRYSYKIFTCRNANDFSTRYEITAYTDGRETFIVNLILTVRQDSAMKMLAWNAMVPKPCSRAGS